MDELTLLISFTEYYGFLKNIPGNRVYTTLDHVGMLTNVLESGKQFPDMDLDFYIGMVDGMMAGAMAMENDMPQKAFGGYQERTALLLDVIGRIAKKHHMNAKEACNLYYNSRTAAEVADDRTGYYKKSADEIFALVEKE